MSITDRLAAADRLQRSRRFKLAASAVIVVLAIVTAVTFLYLSRDVDPELGELTARAQEVRAELQQSLRENDGTFTAAMNEQLSEFTSLQDRANRLRLQQIEEGGLGITPRMLEWAYPAIGVGALVMIAAVWIGLSLSYLALAAIGFGVALPLVLLGGELRGIGLLIGAVAPLLVMLLTLLELARLVLSPSLPATAIARNVLNEAVRMRISLVFIVVLVLLLAVIPLVLTPDQPLRYRVSQWIQYGGGLGFAVLALMTVFFCAASVAFEQRDKLIWQTVSKPVAAWQYVLGKWLGVMTLNLALLSMTAGAVFLFTQYLRMQPAQGEVAPYITEEGFDTRLVPSLMTDDRRILETEVLVARESVLPDLPPSLRRENLLEDGEFQELVQEQVAARQETNPDLQVTEDLLVEVRDQVIEQINAQYRSIPRQAAQTFRFSGLQEAAELGEDGRMVLRYRVQAGSNDPSAIYRLGFEVNGVAWPQPSMEPGATAVTAPGVQQVALDAMQRLSIPATLIDEEGRLFVTIFNYPENRWTVSFEPGDLELLYPVGGYEMNFAKAVVVMWLKLGFIAAVAIVAATFLSFPVAVLMALVVLFAAESAGFLTSSLDDFATLTREGDVRPFRAVVRTVAMPVAWFFESYAQLKPVERLTTGRVLGWGAFGFASLWIVVWTLAVLAAGVAIFRKRELAIYSGS